ncbi:reverse transcriptase domain-containing protein [Tanacetum coccineum]
MTGPEERQSRHTFAKIMFQVQKHAYTDPEADPEEDDDEDPKEDPIDYPADGGDDRDDKMDIEEDEGEDMDIDADEEDKDNEMDPFETDESAATPPPQIPFLLSLPSPVLTAPPSSHIRSLGYRAATIRMRAEAAATSHSLPLPPPFILSPTRPDAPPPMPTSAPTSLPPLLLPSASHREDRPEVNLPPRKRLGIALGPSYEVGESSAAAAARPAGGLRADYGFVATMDREIRRDPERYVGYGITDSWDEIVETLQGAPVSTDTELGAHVRDFESMVRRDTDEIYTMLDDEQSQRRLLADLLETDRGRREEMRDLRAAGFVTRQDGRLLDIVLVMQTLQREDDSTSRTSPTRQGQVTAFTGNRCDITGAGYDLPKRTAGTAWGSTQPELPGGRLGSSIKMSFVMLYISLKMAPKEPQGQHRGQQPQPQPLTVTNAPLKAMIDQGAVQLAGSERVARGVAPYQDFMKCKPLYFKGTEGVVELTQWFERMETVFRISNCSVENQKKMTDKYCPRNEMKKLEAELWNLKVIGTDVVKYNQRFQELALLCVRMFPEESDKIERYVGGLPDHDLMETS